LGGEGAGSKTGSKALLCPLSILQKCRGFSFDFTVTKLSTKIVGSHFDRLPILGKKFGKVVESIVSARTEAVAAIGECTEEICLDVFTRISMLKKDDVKISMKQRALKDFYDVLKANGFSDVAHVSAENTGNLMIIFEMHIPVVQGYLEQLNTANMTDALVHQELSQLWAKSDQYHYKGISQLQLLRGSLMTSRFVASFSSCVRMSLCFLLRSLGGGGGSSTVSQHVSLQSIVYNQLRSLHTCKYMQILV
jgi:hypothetical protein